MEPQQMIEIAVAGYLHQLLQRPEYATNPALMDPQSVGGWDNPDDDSAGVWITTPRFVVSVSIERKHKSAQSGESEEQEDE